MHVLCVYLSVLSRYQEAAISFSQSQLSFEEVALKFIQVDRTDALKTFLVKKLASLHREVSLNSQEDGVIPLSPSPSPSPSLYPSPSLSPSLPPSSGQGAADNVDHLVDRTVPESTWGTGGQGRTQSLQEVAD